MSGANPWASGLPAPPPAPPLLDLLGARWMMDVPVTGVAWAGDLAGFSLGDGSVAMARAEWDGAPTVTQQERGMEVTPASAVAPPVSRQRLHDGACLAIAAGPTGFLTGGADGGLVQLAADGTLTRLAALPGPGILVASSDAGWAAAAAGRQLHVVGPVPAVVDLPASATALAFDTMGTVLAVAHDGGVTLWSAAGMRGLTTTGLPCSVAWSQDGACLACGLQDNAIHGWRLSDGGDIAVGATPGPPRSVSFFADGTYLASSGAPRVICWPFDPSRHGQPPAECGLPASRMPVCRVACHPHLPLVAAGYQNGAVLLCQPGADAVLVVRGSGLATATDPAGLAISALAWSADGGRLAIGTDGGDIGVVALPARLFRTQPSRGWATPDRMAS